MNIFFYFTVLGESNNTVPLFQFGASGFDPRTGAEREGESRTRHLLILSGLWCGEGEGQWLETLPK